MKKYIKLLIVALAAIVAVPASAVIVTNASNFANFADAFPATATGKAFVLEGTVDLAAQNAAGSTNAAAGQVAVIKIPSGAMVEGVSAQVVSYPLFTTALFTNSFSAAATTFDVGDGDAANNWLVTQALTNGATYYSTPVLTTTGAVGTAICTPVNGLGKSYDATQNINVRFTAAPGISGVIKVRVACFKMK